MQQKSDLFKGRSERKQNNYKGNEFNDLKHEEKEKD
jgi:hypothetical protein